MTLFVRINRKGMLTMRNKTTKVTEGHREGFWTRILPFCSIRAGSLIHHNILNMYDFIHELLDHAR